MLTVLLVIHLMVGAALVGVVLLQRSEGGALGIGGGGFMTGRGAANLLTRTTAYLAAAFFATSLLLTLVAGPAGVPHSVFDTPGPGAPPTSQPAPATPSSQPAAPEPGRGGILDKLQPPAGGAPPARSQ
jgi:preprotein translocase subunit SecG